MVGTGRFELPTPRTPSECSTRLSHVPTRKHSTDAQSYHEATRQAPTEGFTPRFYTTTAILRQFWTMCLGGTALSALRMNAFIEGGLYPPGPAHHPCRSTPGLSSSDPRPSP